MDSRTKRQTFGPRGCLATADPDINSSQEKAVPFACVSLLFDGECICVCCGCCCRHPSITLVPASPTFPYGLRTRNSLGILQAFRSQIGTAEISSYIMLAVVGLLGLYCATFWDMFVSLLISQVSPLVWGKHFSQYKASP